MQFVVLPELHFSPEAYVTSTAFPLFFQSEEMFRSCQKKRKTNQQIGQDQTGKKIRPKHFFPLQNNGHAMSLVTLKPER